MAQQMEPKKLRLYKNWKGNNRFFCGGRLIFGPDVASLSLSILLIAVPALTFCIQIIIKISNSDGKGQHPILGLPVLIIASVMTISDLIFLFITSSRDPGIVPRNTRPPENDETVNITTPSMEWISGQTPHMRIPRTKDVIVNGFTVKVKYCDTCMLYRPPRASHCSVCNNCVQKFDHHCPWVGQCIGRRNYRFFCLFISTSTFLCIFVFFFSWLNIITERRHHGNSIWKSMRAEVLSLLLILYTFVIVWFVGGLTIFHFYLMSTNQTTYENFRYRYDKKDNPYNKGFWRNLMDVFFSKIPPSQNNFRSFVIGETLEAGTYNPNVGMSMISPKEKIDIEMGSKHSVDSNLPIPTILQNLDYSSLGSSENIKLRQDSDDYGFDLEKSESDGAISIEEDDVEIAILRNEMAIEEDDETVKDIH